MTNNVETQMQRTERILEISCELNSTVSLEPLLHKIVEAAAELTDSEAASILLLDERAGTLRFIAASVLGDQLADIPVPVEGSIAGATFSSGEPQIVHDVPADPRYYKEVERLVGLEASKLEHTNCSNTVKASVIMCSSISAGAVKCNLIIARSTSFKDFIGSSPHSIGTLAY